MPFGKRELRALEALAALKLSDAERTLLLTDLQRVLEYMRRLDALDVTDVPPTTHALDVIEGEAGQALREDRVLPSLPAQDILANAPDRQDGFYRVPRFVGEGEVS